MKMIIFDPWPKLYMMRNMKVEPWKLSNTYAFIYTVWWFPSEVALYYSEDRQWCHIFEIVSLASLEFAIFQMAVIGENIYIQILG